MEYKSKLHEWVRAATPYEQKKIAKQAGVKVHFLQRLARKEVKNPGINSVRLIVKAIYEHNLMQPDNRLPEVKIDDI